MIRYLHWNKEEAEERAVRLESLGFLVNCEQYETGSFKTLKANLPDAYLIDLDRLPSHGRYLGMHLRDSKATRNVPLVFIGGKPEKVAIVKGSLPDATFTDWENVESDLSNAIAFPVRQPVVPGTSFDAHKQTPLTRKLGIKADSTVTIIDEPGNFRSLLDLPDSVTLRTSLRGKRDLTIWFVSRLALLENRIDKIADTAGKDGVWICWIKKSAKIKSDITQFDLRKIGIAAGLVDYKVCSIDETWSAFKFAVKK